MALRKIINYPNGGRLLVFNGGNVKYMPSAAYEEARKKAMSTPALSPKPKNNPSPFKTSSLLVDRIFAEKVPNYGEELVGKAKVIQIMKINESKVKSMNVERPQHHPRTHAPNYLRLATHR